MFEVFIAIIKIFQPIFPLIGLCTIFGIIKLFVDQGIKEGTKILIRTVIGIAVSILIAIIVLQFI